MTESSQNALQVGYIWTTADREKGQSSSLKTWQEIGSSLNFAMDIALACQTHGSLLSFTWIGVHSSVLLQNRAWNNLSTLA